MIHYYGDRTFLSDSLFNSSENAEFHRGSTKPLYAGITIEYAEVGRLELIQDE